MSDDQETPNVEEEDAAAEETPAASSEGPDNASADSVEIEPDEHLHVDPYERNWIRISVLTMVVFAVAVTAAGLALGIQVPTDEGRVDPNTLATTPPWSEPGLREVVPGEEYDLYIVARRFAFAPNEVEIPQGAKVNFYATSGDVQHGLKLADTNVNFMIIPGQVSKLSAVFDEVGEYDYICHEYCGLAHAVMFGQLRVVPAEGGA